MRRLIVVLLCSFAMGAFGAPVFFQVSGSDASGTIDGTPFSGAAWVLEAEADDTAADTQASATTGAFAFTGLKLSINGDVYELDISGFASKELWFGQADLLYIELPGSNALRMFASPGSFYPTILTDVNDLSTAVRPASFTNSTADVSNNTNILNFTTISSLGGNAIVINEVKGPGAGGFSGTTSNASVLTNSASSAVQSVPSMPLSFLLMLGFSIGIVGLRKSKKS